MPETKDSVVHADMVGKTIASVTESDVTMRDTYGDEVTVTRTLISFTDGSEQTFGDVHIDLYETDETDEPNRPTTVCGCGHELVWICGGWQHNVAPDIWGDDHDPNEPAPTGPAREYWDEVDCVTES